MRFWTNLQGPRHRAVLVEDGRIVRSIPEATPQTPARRVGLVGEFNGKLVLGRHASIEMWDRDGIKPEYDYHADWMFGMHQFQQWQDLLFVVCGGLDCVMGYEVTTGKVKWEWWAWVDGHCPEPEFFMRDKEEWAILQLTKDLGSRREQTAHLNSLLIHDGHVLVSSLRCKKIFKIPLVLPPAEAPVSEVLMRTAEGLHAPAYLEEKLCYGLSTGIVIGGKLHKGFPWVKQIKVVGDHVWFTFEHGVVQMDPVGRVLKKIPLPRPFGFALLEP